MSTRDIFANPNYHHYYSKNSIGTRDQIDTSSRRSVGVWQSVGAPVLNRREAVVDINELLDSDATSTEFPLEDGMQPPVHTCPPSPRERNVVCPRD